MPTNPPAAPSDVTVTSQSTSAIGFSWTNNSSMSPPDQEYFGIKVYRDGSLLENIGGGGTSSYTDSSLPDGTAHSYKVCAWNSYYQDSSFSNEITSNTTLAAPSGLHITGSPTSATLYWTDNCQNESGFNIYRTPAGGTTFFYLGSVGANETSYYDGGLDSAQWYKYYVIALNAVCNSPDSSEIRVFTSDPPNAPSLLTATATATTKIRLNWQDNASNEDGFSIYESDDGVTYTLFATLTGANIQTYEATGLVSNQTYWWKVQSFNSSGNSDYSNAAAAATFAAISQPTNLTVTPWGAGTLGIAFDDNSELEDSHRLEQSDDGSTGWAEIATLVPNRTTIPVTGLGNGTLRYFRVRAKQGSSSYSAYSEIVSGTTLDVPADPSSLAVSEYQDAWVRLTWAGSVGAEGYEIYGALHGGAYSLYRTVMAGVLGCRVSGLAASTEYDFKIRAINAAGASGYTGVVSATTRAVYLRSAFERLQMEQSPLLIHLVEINPTIDLSGWSLVPDKSYTYKKVLSEPRAVTIDTVAENGVDLVIQTSIVNVEANAGSFYFDSPTQTVYVHSSGSNNPVNYFYVGAFWLYFTTGDPRNSTEKQPVVFNDHFYVPLVPADGIPDITQTISPYYKGSFTQSHGNLSLINGVSPAWGDVGFFDQLYARYNWKGRKIRSLIGGVNFTYAEFYVPATGIVADVTISDQRIDFTMSDYREKLKLMLPKDDYWIEIFPNLGADVQKGNPRPFHWGAVVGFSPACIDTVKRVFELHNGRIESVANVYKNGAALTVDTDYFIDYQRGRITLARGLAYATEDKITADFTGQVDGLGAAIQTGPMIFLDLLTRFMDVPLADINLDSIYDSAAAETTLLSLSIYKQRSTEEIVGLLEKSCMAYSFQDHLGRLGFQVAQTVAPSGIIYIQECRVSNFSISDPSDNTYSGVDLGYAENFQGNFTTLARTVNANKWRDGANERLPINTAIPSATNADALASKIILELNKRIVTFDIDRALYTAQSGDLIYFTRARYFSASGTAANFLLRVMSITKTPAGGMTSIIAQEVL